MAVGQHKFHEIWRFGWILCYRDGPDIRLNFRKLRVLNVVCDFKRVPQRNH
jgi:hypothetical protein